MQQFLTLTEPQQKDLNRILLIISIILFFSGSYIANYLGKNADEAWSNFALILRFIFLIIIISLRQEVKKLIGKIGYRIIVYIILNNFIDRYFGIEEWSLNDTLTIIALGLEYLTYNLRKNLTK